MDMTQKLDVQEVVIDGKTYVQKDSVLKPAKEMDGMKCVLVRSYAAGVHFGYLATKDHTKAGTVVTLMKTRRVWYWDGAASLSQMAVDGVSKPENCKFSVEVDQNEIINVIEILQLTEKAMLNLYGVAIWKK